MLIERLHRRGRRERRAAWIASKRRSRVWSTQELRDLIRKHPACGRLRERFASDETIPLDPYEFYDVLFSGGPWMDLQNEGPTQRSAAGAIPGKRSCSLVAVAS